MAITDSSVPVAVHDTPCRIQTGNGIRAANLLVAIGILVHIAVLLSLKFGWLNALFNDSSHRFGPGCDFFSIYAAGAKAHAGMSVYGIGDHVDNVPYAYAFRYAPLVAYTLGWLLSLLPAIQSYAFWLILCELALLRNIRLTLEMAPNKARGRAAAALWLLFSPYYLELYVGQFTFLTASLVFWSWLGWQSKDRRSRVGADLAFASAVWLKMMPLLYLPIALFQRRWTGAVLTVIVLLASFALYFSQYPADWPIFLATNLDPRPTWHAGNHGLMALLYGLSGENLALFVKLRLGVLALVGGFLIWAIHRVWKQWKKDEAATCPLHLYVYAACSAAYLLIYKDVWEHHYVLILPPIVLMALRGERARVWLPAFVIAALPGLFVLYDVHGIGYNEDPQHYWLPSVSILHHAMKPLSAIWLFTASLAMLRRTAESPAIEKRQIGRPLRWAGAITGLATVIAFGVWARAAIAQQAQVSTQIAWPDSVFQKQQRRETCGAAALAAVCRHYGISATEEEIALLAGTNEFGTSMGGLRSAAQKKGLVAEGVQLITESLKRSPCPSILYFHAGHFAVLTGVRDNRYYLADPSLGQHIWTAETLQKYWTGETLVVGPSEELKENRLQ